MDFGLGLALFLLGFGSGSITKAGFYLSGDKAGLTALAGSHYRTLPLAIVFAIVLTLSLSVTVTTNVSVLRLFLDKKGISYSCNAWNPNLNLPHNAI